MPDSPRQTNVITAATVKFADDEAGLTTASSYGCVVTGSGFVPSPNLVEVPATGCAPKGQVASASSWVLELTHLQDWNSPAGGLSGYLYANDSLRKWVMVTPTSPSLPAATAEVTIVASQYAGTFGDLLVAAATLPTVEKPDITLPAVTEAAADEDATDQESVAA